MGRIGGRIGGKGEGGGEKVCGRVLGLNEINICLTSLY